MSHPRRAWLLLLPLLAAAPPAAADPPVADWLAKEIIGPRLTMQEVQEYIQPRVPRVPEFASAEAWQKFADQTRAKVLNEVVFRGEAAAWRDAKTEVEWLDTLPGGEGYSLRKVRYEALPGTWIPAILYEPDKLADKVPVMLAVNGHDGAGKAADYKQVRCINLAKRGMRVLNVEWFGMGQLREPGFQHYAMNQLDLCGTSGLAPFCLSMKRGIDVLLSLPKSDPARVAVSGLSGGGWQTIFISSLDERVTLANPVAGYSSFRTRVRHLKDLGDSEQTPSDLATVADYTHLTAMRAPRPTLLTYNSKDQCCFESGYALPPLVDAAAPVFKLLGRPEALRTHVNDDPGTHNFERENREALYRMVGDFFYAGDKSFSAEEIPCEKELKTKDDLYVPLPEGNLTFNALAKRLAKDLPVSKGQGKNAAERLRRLLHTQDYAPKMEKTGEAKAGDTSTTFWKFKLGDVWTVPGVEIAPPDAKGTTILLHDGGRKAASAEVERLLKEGQRVVAVDLFYFGESKIEQKDFLFALTLATIGERPLGVQVSQLAAIARGLSPEGKGPAPRVVAVGPRMSLAALCAAAAYPEAITGVELHDGWDSLKHVIEQNVTVNQMPEVFCFGLLREFDVARLIELVESAGGRKVVRK